MKTIMSTTFIALTIAAGFASTASANPNSFSERYFETLKETGA